MRTFLLILAAIVSEAAGAGSTTGEMEARNKASLAKDGAYEMAAVQAFWGDASFMQECAPPGSPPAASFVVYFEVLPDGTLGDTVFEPLTEAAKCIKKHTAQRTFPKPPFKYVAKIEMSFKP